MPVKTLVRGALVADEGWIVGAPGMGSVPGAAEDAESAKRLVYPLARAATHGNAHLFDSPLSEEDSADRPASSRTCPKGSVALEEGGPDTGGGLGVGVARVRIVHPVVSRPVR